MKRVLRGLPFFVVAGLLGAGLGLVFRGETLRGQPPAPGSPRQVADPERERVERGASSYHVYCASCHGRAAEGNGPMAEVLKVAPTDLTQLAHKHGGVFPEGEAEAAIDGRQGVRGHGSRDMPVWGFGFQTPGRDSDQEREVREKIRDLLAYLKSIQK